MKFQNFLNFVFLNKFNYLIKKSNSSEIKLNDLTSIEDESENLIFFIKDFENDLKKNFLTITILKCIKNLLIFNGILTLFELIISLILPLILKNLIKNFSKVENLNSNFYLNYINLIFILSIFKEILNLTLEYINEIASWRIIRIIRYLIYKKGILINKKYKINNEQEVLYLSIR
jgi:hypothetical protein